MNKFIMINGIVTTLGVLAIMTYRFGAWGVAPTLAGALAASIFWCGYVAEQRDRVEAAREIATAVMASMKAKMEEEAEEDARA